MMYNENTYYFRKFRFSGNLREEQEDESRSSYKTRVYDLIFLLQILYDQFGPTRLLNNNMHIRTRRFNAVYILHCLFS